VELRKHPIRSLFSYSLAICGNSAPIEEAELKKYDEVWALGTSNIVGATKYWEFHNIPCNKSPLFGFKDIPKRVLGQALPMSNSICVLLVYAMSLGYSRIDILRSPLTARHEYLVERPSLAYLVATARAQGIFVEWEGGVKNSIYMNGGMT